MRSYEDRGGEGLLRGGGNWGQKYWTLRSREDTGGGSFEKQGSTGDLAAELEKGQLPAQDPRSGDFPTFSFFLCSRFFH